MQCSVCVRYDSKNPIGGGGGGADDGVSEAALPILLPMPPKPNVVEVRYARLETTGSKPLNTIQTLTPAPYTLEGENNR